MINKLHLELFKCFKSIVLELGKLNLLSGENASGKSSLIQSLLVINQTMRANEWSNRLVLNGDNINLGTVSDVIDKVNGRNNISIKVEDCNDSIEWYFSGERSQLSMSIEKIQYNNEIIDHPHQLQFLSPPAYSNSSIINSILNLVYIKAERCGPRDYYPLSDDNGKRIISAGENSVALLFNNRDKEVIESLVLNDSPPTLYHQVQARMNSFFPGFQYELEQLEKINAVTLGIRTSEDTDFHRPTNVGFGITQVLPIIIACLLASENEMLIIENPEVHLHPKGQALMGEFLAIVANTGVQLIVESHSDHILNGIRRAVKENKVSNEDIKFYFFNNRVSSSNQIISPQINENGKIDHWPNGFFDQFDKDISFLAGWDI